MIVTYGNRFHLIKDVIEEVLKQGVKKVIIVDNDSAYDSRKLLRKMADKNPQIELMQMNENTGSAGGYKAGIEKAEKDENCEFIWLLDDDNRPKPSALENLINFWNELKDPKKEEKIALASFREDRPDYKSAVAEGKTFLLLGKTNSFIGFHISDLPQKLFKTLKKFLRVKKRKNKASPEYGIVPVAPYGGMFFHKKLIRKIGYPDERLFLYADDHEWTYRITKCGGKIFMVFTSILEDIDKSWFVGKGKNFFRRILEEGSDLRIYYAVRNRVFFEYRNLVKSRFVYGVNRLAFKFILNLTSLGKHRQRIKLFNTAVKDGIAGNLGRRKELENQETQK